MPPPDFRGDQPGRALHLDNALKPVSSAIDQEVPDMGRAAIRLFPAARLGEVNRLASDVILGEAAAPRDLLDGVAVAIAPAKNPSPPPPRGIAPQPLFAPAVTLR